MQDLGDLPGGGDASLAFGVNNAGQVVGYSHDATGSRAFLWTASGGMQDLNDMISGGGLLLEARAISDTGYIVGHGIQDGTGFTQAFLLTPISDVPLPAGAALLPVALAGLALFRRRAA